jgi:hypothetical protein
MGSAVRIRRQGKLFNALGAIFCNFRNVRAGSLGGVTGANTIQAAWVATQTFSVHKRKTFQLIIARIRRTNTAAGRA